MTLQVPLTTIRGGSNSPWSVPLQWDSLEVLGVVYGPANPDGVGGKVTIRRAKRHYKWQKKDPPGADGYTSTYHGISPKEFDIIFWHWTGPQFDRLNGQIIPMLQVVGTKGKTNPVNIYHPGLAAIGIDQVTTDHILIPEPVSEDKPDMWRWVVQVTEYRPPPDVNTSSTPKTPEAQGGLTWNMLDQGGPKPNPVIESLRKSIAENRDKLKADPGGPPTPFG